MRVKGHEAGPGGAPSAEVSTLNFQQPDNDQEPNHWADSITYYLQAVEAPTSCHAKTPSTKFPPAVRGQDKHPQAWATGLLLDLACPSITADSECLLGPWETKALPLACLMLGEL